MERAFERPSIGKGGVGGKTLQTFEELSGLVEALKEFGPLAGAASEGIDEMINELLENVVCALLGREGVGGLVASRFTPSTPSTPQSWSRSSGRK